MDSMSSRIASATVNFSIRYVYHFILLLYRTMRCSMSQCIMCDV